MAKAQDPAQEGDNVKIIKEDKNNGKEGVVFSRCGDTLEVMFDGSVETFDYTPDDVILLVD